MKTDDRDGDATAGGMLGAPPEQPRNIQSLKDVAIAEIRRRIFGGLLRPNDKIDQDDIAKDLRISRLPVREALIALENQGLVRNVPRRGAFVMSLTQQDVRDHYEIFGLVTKLAAERAATNLEPDELAELRQIVEAAEGTATDVPQEDYNFRFHRIINRSAHSRRIADLVRQLGRNLPSHFYEYDTGWGPHEDHRKILSALEARDPDAAGEEMYQHLKRGGDHAVEFLAAAGFWDAPESGAEPAAD